MELLKLRRRLKLAEKGHKLLKQKQDVLVLEFFNVLKEIKQVRTEIGTKLATAQISLLNAQALEGVVNVERVAATLSSGAELQLSKKSIMGVEFPQIENIEVKQHGFGYFDQSLELDNAILHHRKLLPQLLKLAEKQIMLKKLADEIKKTKRRVNSLEYLIIPSINETMRLITFKLEELERESFTRLKKIKEASEKDEIQA